MHGHSLAMIYVCQTVPKLLFGHMANEGTNARFTIKSFAIMDFDDDCG